MNRKRGPYSSPRQQDRRLRILRAAGTHLQKHGLEALTMQSIAEVSEVSTKTLYNLFGSRDLLLLESASERLVDLEQSDFVLDAEPGIPQLLAYTVGTMRQFEEAPVSARAVISILLRADLDAEAAYANYGPVQRFAYSALCTAAEQGELHDNIDLLELSYLVATNEWGTVLLWEKGLLELEHLARHMKLNQCMTLIPACIGRRRKALEKELNELFNDESAAKLTSGDTSAVSIAVNREKTGETRTL